MLTVLEYAFREAFVSCMLQRASIIHTDMALTRKKKIWGLYLFMPAKTFLLVLCSGWISLYHPGDIFYQLMYQLIALIVFLVIAVIYVWLWEGEPLHILLMFIIMDGITCVLVTVPMFINYLEGRANIMELAGPFHPLDVLIPLLMLLITQVIHPHMKRLAHFLGGIYLPHRRLLWLFLFAYVFIERLSFPLLNNPEDNATRIVVAECSLMTVLIAVLMAQQVLFHLRSQREEEEFLDIQMQLLRRRAVVTQYSRSQMAETRKIITRQMQELDTMLESNSSDEQSIDAEVLKGYLWELQGSEKLQTAEGAEARNSDQTGQNFAGYRGRYCRDILTDEVLSQIFDSAEAHGDRITISLRNYDSGRITDEDLARILYCLAYAEPGKKTTEEKAGDKTGKKPGEAVRDRELSLTGTNGQLIIRMSADRLQIPRSRVIAMQSVIRKYKGELSFTRSSEREEAYVMLPV